MARNNSRYAQDYGYEDDFDRDDRTSYGRTNRDQNYERRSGYGQNSNYSQNNYGQNYRSGRNSAQDNRLFNRARGWDDDNFSLGSDRDEDDRRYNRNYNRNMSQDYMANYGMEDGSSRRSGRSSARDYDDREDRHYQGTLRSSGSGDFDEEDFENEAREDDDFRDDFRAQRRSGRMRNRDYEDDNRVSSRRRDEGSRWENDEDDDDRGYRRRSSWE